MSAAESLPRALLRAFWEGLTRPRLAAVAGAAAVLTGSVLSVTPSRMVGLDRGYLMLYEGDTAADATLAVLDYEAAPHPDRALVLLGSSPFREGLESEAEVGAALTRRLGTPIAFTGLYLGHATLLEIGAMADRLPEGLRGTVLIEVGLVRLTCDLQRRARSTLLEPWQALDSEFLDREMRELGVDPGWRTGLHLIDHLPFYSARHSVFRRWLTGTPLALPPRMQMRDDYPRDVRAIARQILADEREMAATYADRIEPNLQLLGKIVEMLRDRGLTVALIESTMSPTRRGRLAALLDRYRARLAVYCRDLKLPYVDLTAAAGLVQSDFYDAVHIWKTPARKRLQGAFIAGVGDLLAAGGAR